MVDGYNLVARVPSVEEHTHLRSAAGLSPYTEEATRAGLPGTVFAVVIEHAGQAVGMGRIIGDGGLFFQIVDVGVDPAHQGKGLGKAVMAALMAHVQTALPPSAHVSLIADVPANKLYEKYGFAETAPRSVGMAMRVPAK